MKKVILLLALMYNSAFAHQFTPTYPKFDKSFIEGVVQTRMELFNVRKDVEFYELDVYDGEWNKIPFATEDKLLRLKYLDTKKITVYLREQELSRAVYICSESRVRKEDAKGTVVSSKICSKIKQ